MCVCVCVCVCILYTLIINDHLDCQVDPIAIILATVNNAASHTELPMFFE